MFTGIIEATAAVLQNTNVGIVVERPEAFDDLRAGSSICVSGACLTIVEFNGRSMRFDMTEETLRRTTLGSLRKGSRVNLERALKVGDRLEGHIVQGHVDATGVCRGAPPVLSGVEGLGRPGHAILTVSCPSSLRSLIVEKGSIALDGVSLTVAEVNGDAFSVALIPQTLAGTTLRSLEGGDAVNLEADILGKYVLALWLREIDGGTIS